LIIGWGQTSTSISSDILLKAQVPIVQKRGVDVCLGDTGGPLICSDLGYYYLAGIASWGWKCGAPAYPGVYTEVSSYRSSYIP